MKKTRGQDILLLLLFLLLVVFVSYVFMNKEHFMAKKTQPDYNDKKKCHGTKKQPYPCSFNDVPNYYDPETCLIVVAPPSKGGKGDDEHYFRCATRKDLDNISNMPKDRDMNVCYIVKGCGSGHVNSGVNDIKAFKGYDPAPQQCISCKTQ